MPTVKRTFRIKVKIRSENAPALAQGMEPGVIAHQDVIFDLPEPVFESPMFVRTLLDAREKLMRDNVTTIVEEIE